MENDYGDHLSDWYEQCHDDTGKKRRAVEDSTNYANEEELVNNGGSNQQRVIAPLAEAKLPRFMWDSLH